MQMIIDDDLQCYLDPAGRPAVAGDSLRSYEYAEQELVRRINSPRSIRIEDIEPQSIGFVVTNLAQKRVPLVYNKALLLEPREGFQIIGRPKISPDSVTLSGAPDALEQIAFWRIQPVPLEDLDEPTNLIVKVSDTLRGVVNVHPEEARLSIDIQEAAEVVINNVQVVNRGLISDTAMELILYPSHITVTLRGGADELGKLSDVSVMARIDIIPERDSLGSIRPTILLPPLVNATIIDIAPRNIRYVWRKRLAGVPVKGGR